MIRFDNVTFARRQKEVLKNFSLQIKKGQKICLFGPSGCGKTSALRLICGLDTPKSGTVTVKGSVSVVFQENRLCPHISVLKNLLTVTDDKTEALKVLDALGISDIANSLPTKISGGQARRVAIARALCVDADILVLDEPFNGIDSDNLQKVCHTVLQKYGDKTIVMVSHNKSHAGMLSAEIINM